MTQSALQQAPDQPPVTIDLGEAELRTLRDRLLEERRFRLTQLTALREELAEDPRASHDEVAITLRSGASAALGDIEAALLRMDEGAYGVCTGCRDAISPERLDALPMAGLCMPCQRRRSIRAR